jgi:hypothetical protein
MKKARQAPLFIRTIIWALVLTSLATAWVPQEGAAMLAPATSSAPAVGSGADRSEDLQKVQRVLENKLIQQRLADIGLTMEEVNARMDGLSDAQLHQMAAQIDALLPGGSVDLTTIIALLVIVILVILLIALL